MEIPIISAMVICGVLMLLFARHVGNKKADAEESLSDRVNQTLAQIDDTIQKTIDSEPPAAGTQQYKIGLYPPVDTPDDSTRLWVSDRNLIIVGAIISPLTAYINDPGNDINEQELETAINKGSSAFLDIRRIPINAISYFMRDGSMYVTQDISGGGSNIGGAIVGGLLGGVAGAVIGSHNKTNIKTSSQVHDQRRVVLFYNDDKGQSCDISLPDEAYMVLMHLIPNKEYSRTVQTEKSAAISIEDKLKQLKSLLDQNLITQDEYNTKRQDILNKL